MLITTALFALGSFGLANLPTICSIGGAVGVVATTVEAVNAGREDAENDRELAQNETKKERRKRKIRTYAKTAIKGAATIGGIMLADRLHVRKYTKLALVAGRIAQNHLEYKAAAREILGKDGEQKIEEKKCENKAEEVYKKCLEQGIEPIDTHTGSQLFFEPESGIYFLASLEHVLEAEYDTNRNFILKQYMPFSEWLQFLLLDADDIDDPEFHRIGWNDFSGEAIYGYRWIDFSHKELTLPNGMKYTMIWYPFAPHLGEE